MKLQAAEFKIASATRRAPGIFQVTAIGPTTYTFHVFTSVTNPIVLSSEVLELAEIGDPGRHAITALLTAIYYLNKQEIHEMADETT
jgi:hypothetical protein